MGGTRGGKRSVGIVALIDIVKYPDSNLSGNILTLSKNITNTVRTLPGVQFTVVKHWPLTVIENQLEKKIKSKTNTTNILIQIEEEWLRTRHLVVK